LALTRGRWGHLSDVQTGVAPKTALRYKPSAKVAGLRCGGQPDEELPWRSGSKRGKFVKGELTLSERKPSRAATRACLADINDCGKGALSYAHLSKALRLLREQVSVQCLVAVRQRQPRLARRRPTTHAWVVRARATTIPSAREGAAYNVWY